MNRKMIPKLSTPARLGPTTLDRDNRTVTVVASTGSRGSREDYDESLDVTKANLTRLNSGHAPLLNSHRSDGIENILGSVERAWIEGENLMASVRFSKTPLGDQALAMVEDRTLGSVSIGYQVKRYQDVTTVDDKRPHYRATDWDVLEVSMVAVPFDRDAIVRSREEKHYEVEIINASEDAESKESMSTDKTELKRQIQKEERAREKELRTIAKQAGLDESELRSWIDNDTTVDEARRLALASLEFSRQSSAAIQIGVLGLGYQAEIGETSQDKQREGFEQAILARADRSFKPTVQSANLFMDRTFPEMVERFYGKQLGESRSGLIRRSMTTGDLPNILSNVANKGAQARYKVQPGIRDKIASRDTLKNYKLATRVRGGEFANLLPVLESGEITYSAVGEEVETAQLERSGRILSMSHVMLTNDDLSVLSDIIQTAGQSAARLEEAKVISALSNNTRLMGDGQVLYHSSRNNIGTPGAFSATTFTEAFVDMAAQTSVDSLEVLGLRPKYLVVPTTLEWEARAFLAPIQASQSSNSNPFTGSVEVLVSPLLTDDKYYFVCDPADVKTIVLYGMEGESGPRIETRVRFENDAFELKTTFDCEAQPLDWRGMYRNEKA